MRGGGGPVGATYLSRASLVWGAQGLAVCGRESKDHIRRLGRHPARLRHRSARVLTRDLPQVAANRPIYEGRSKTVAVAGLYREIGEDTTSFLLALRAALRQDPDVILIGEMRDTETVQVALQAAETGHLVLSTLHTVNATETVSRLVDFFPAHQQQQIRLTLAGALRGIICQRLVPSVTGDRLPCLEVLVNTGRVAERIADAARTSEIEEVIAAGGYYGMRTFDQGLLERVLLGEVRIEDAMDASSEPHDFTLMLQQAGLSVPEAGRVV